MPLIPRDERYFVLCDQLGRTVADAAALVRLLFEAPDRREELVGRIKAVRHEADAATHEVVVRLDTTFVTPLDRDDIQLLVTRLDHVVDSLGGTARRMSVYEIREVPAEARRLAAVVEQAALEIRTAAGALRSPPALMEHVRWVRTLEEEADPLYQDAVRALFRSGADGAAPNALAVMQWKDVYDALAHSVGACQRVARVLESIATKHG